MVGPSATVSLISLTLALAFPISPLMAQELRGTVAVYDDWSVHLLQDGKLRVCYAETKLVSTSEAGTGLGDMRLQVTNRSLSGPADIIRLTKAPESYGAEMYVYIGSVDTFRVYELYFSEFGPPDTWWHTSVVENMKAAEAAKARMVLRRDSDSTSLGGYSLRGFTAAYSSLEQQCSEPPVERTDAQLTSVSDISVVKGPTPYSEFSITGPFFQAQKADRIKIRAVPAEYAFSGGLADTANIAPQKFFAYGSQLLEYYHEGTLVYVDNNRQYLNRIDGVCLDPESGRLRILIYSWGGGATSPGGRYVVFFVPNVGFVQKSAAWIEGPMRLVDCNESESGRQADGRFLPCRCIGRASESTYNSTLDEVKRRLYRLNYRRDDAPTRINDDAFSSLLSRISRLKPFVQWDAQSRLDVQRVESTKFTVVTITYADLANIYGSAQTTFVRRRTDDFWVSVYDAPVSSKGFNKVTVHGFVDDENLDLEMCVEDCGWWGRYDRLNRNVADWLQVALTCRGWYQMEYFKTASHDEVEACLGAGVGVEAWNASGVTPLHRAARYSGNPDVITALIDAGADTEALDDENWTPLHWAARNYDPDAISVLVEVGADLEARDQYGNTPLQLAVWRNDYPDGVVKELIRAGAHVNARDENGYTPLHYAALRYSQLDVLKVLLKAGADLTARDESGYTPLGFAVARNTNREVARVLQDAEAAQTKTETKMETISE